MSSIVWIFTVVILSPQKIVMVAERVNYEDKQAQDIREYDFENSEKGFRAVEKMMSDLKKKNNDPSQDCVFNLNAENKGFVRAGMFPKSMFKDHKDPESQTPRQLAEFCRKKKAGF